MNDYDHKKIEARWQEKWEKNEDWLAKSNGKKFYALVEFPYPSGEGMHVGHLRSYTAMDVVVRKRRREGYNVLFPIGWDAFGLPAENYAIKTGIHPKVTTKTNTDNFRRQLKSVGFSFDWSREVNTSDPTYYRWTQWMFLQFFKAGLAYKANVPINWCPKDKIGLANEEVIDGKCERCGTEVEEKDKEQWMIAITKYSDRLSKDLDNLDYINAVKAQQKNWINGLRDWVFSRQRYWGEPIPLIHCDKDGWVAVPDKELPVLLPDLPDFKPGENGESPLSRATDWINTTCPSCGSEAKRETDVMPNWAGSSWYFLRYTDPNNDNIFADKEKLSYWMPVDWYNGGMEHTTLHLLYSRFWNKFLFDEGLVTSSEPYKKRTSQGIVLAHDGEKMSKSRGNVVNPDSVVERVGADALRLYILFMGPFDQAVSWSDDGIVGTRRFLERVWRLSQRLLECEPDAPMENEVLLHKTIKKVGDEIEQMGFNTAVSSLMILVNEMEKQQIVSIEQYRKLLILLSPFAPHMTEEIWSWKFIGNGNSIHNEPWPEYDDFLIAQEKVEVAVQIDGKTRAIIELNPRAIEEEALEKALLEDKVKTHLEGKNITKTIYVPGKILSILTGDK